MEDNARLTSYLVESIEGIETVKGVFGICILWLGGYLALKGDITVGTLLSFNSLLAYFIEPIERMINLQPELQSAMVAAD